MRTDGAVRRWGTNASVGRCTGIGPEVLEGGVCVGGGNQASESCDGRSNLHIVPELCGRRTVAKVKGGAAGRARFYPTGKENPSRFIYLSSLTTESSVLHAWH